MKIRTKSENGMEERGLGKREGEDWQKRGGAPHLVCALGPATWGSGPGLVALGPSIPLKQRLLLRPHWGFFEPLLGPFLGLLWGPILRPL